MFVEKGENLLHGNEILAGQITGYDRDKKQHHCDHTLANIVRAIQQMFKVPQIHDSVLRTLAEYMILDALIGNTDRHHENWGFLMRFGERQPGPLLTSLRVAPSFDHASSLGRELLDQRRSEILQVTGIKRYVGLGRGGIYLESTERRGANPIRLIEYGVEYYPQYFRPGLERLGQAPLEPLVGLVDEVPPERISDTARTFVKALLEYTYSILLGLV
jgi:HipA-like C-terminal domain